ncbi:MAG: hypothetical protein KDJ26_06620 [Alphaproteobacteria bacterium]|nr:hypothetical protein [Alphaproteobacteria bacterium]MCB9984319.1 hypothetical protein [Micavibrio sp.]
MTDLSDTKNLSGLESPYLAGIAASLYKKSMLRDLALFMANTQSSGELRVLSAAYNPNLIAMIPQTKENPHLLASVSAQTMLDAFAQGGNSIIGKFGSLAKVLKWDEGQFDCLHQIFNAGISAALQAAPKDDPFYTTNIRFLSEAVRQHKELQPAWDAASSSLANKETPLVKTPESAYPVPTV